MTEPRRASDPAPKSSSNGASSLHIPVLGSPAGEEWRSAQDFFDSLTDFVCGYTGLPCLRVAEGAATILIRTDDDPVGKKFGPFETTGFPEEGSIDIELGHAPAFVLGSLHVLWAFLSRTNWRFWWPLRIRLEPLSGARPTVSLVTLYAGSCIGVQGSRAMPILAIVTADELASGKAGSASYFTALSNVPFDPQSSVAGRAKERS